MTHDITIAELSEIVLHPPSHEAPTWYGCLLAGEAGEFANETKKFEAAQENGGFVESNLRYQRMQEEIADVLASVLICAKRFNIDLHKSLLIKARKYAEKLEVKQ